MAFHKYLHCSTSASYRFSHTAYLYYPVLYVYSYSVDAAHHAWQNPTVHYFLNLTETTPHRVEEVIKYEGLYTLRGFVWELTFGSSTGRKIVGLLACQVLQYKYL